MLRNASTLGGNLHIAGNCPQALTAVVRQAANRDRCRSWMPINDIYYPLRRSCHSAIFQLANGCYLRRRNIALAVIQGDQILSGLRSLAPALFKSTGLRVLAGRIELTISAFVPQLGLYIRSMRSGGNRCCILNHLHDRLSVPCGGSTLGISRSQQCDFCGHIHFRDQR